MVEIVSSFVTFSKHAKIIKHLSPILIILILIILILIILINVRAKKVFE